MLDADGFEEVALEFVLILVEFVEFCLDVAEDFHFAFVIKLDLLRCRWLDDVIDWVVVVRLVIWITEAHDCPVVDFELLDQALHFEDLSLLFGLVHLGLRSLPHFQISVLVELVVGVVVKGVSHHVIEADVFNHILGLCLQGSVDYTPRNEWRSAVTRELKKLVADNRAARLERIILCTQQLVRIRMVCQSPFLVDDGLLLVDDVRRWFVLVVDELNVVALNVYSGEPNSITAYDVAGHLGLRSVRV